jgi:membrane-associated phospholipid phosphatase
MALAALISVSTVFVKQHSALDVFAALPLAALLFIAIYKPWRKK